ncbi:MAG: T9SS type A sorting domain-containing protein [Bacteroidia bacterium]
MKKIIFSLFLILTINNAFCQVGQTMGAGCKAYIYKNDTLIYSAFDPYYNLPEDTTRLCPGDSFRLVLSPMGPNCAPYVVQWQNNGVNIPSATTPTCTVVDTGTYSVSFYFASSSLVLLTNVIKVISCNPTGIQQFANNNEVSIYPNPASQLVNLTISQFDNLKMNSVEIFNMLGESIHYQIIKSSNSQIDVADLSEGVYQLIIHNSSLITTKKVVIVR